jgi:hypothetical protein
MKEIIQQITHTHTMKPLSETYKELGIAFAFPIMIKDANGYLTYYEDSEGWEKCEFDAKCDETYYENSDGCKEGTPRSGFRGVNYQH